MYTALYRTERPETFEEVLGQDHIVRILKNQVMTDTVGHAYLFCGTRGTGKTTMARLLAKAVNCTADNGRPCGVCDTCKAVAQGNYMDLVEIDAASNNGVDSVRELRESVNYPPAVGRKKVYIIDEVHMLSTAAFNALLKTLEEPPEHVLFILATTDPQKLPQTIVSRCMRFDFHRVPERLIASKMKSICDERGIAIAEDALHLLAVNADGSMRDGLSLLDQCLAGNTRELTRDTVLEYLGTVADEFFIELTDMILEGNPSGALMFLDGALREGKDVKLLLGDFLTHYRSLLIAKYVERPEDMLNMSPENVSRLKEQAQATELADINQGIITLAKTINDARYSTQPRILMELAIVTLATGTMEVAEPVARPKKTAPRSGFVPEKRVAPAPVEEPAPAPVAPAAPAREEKPVVPESVPEKKPEPKKDLALDDMAEVWETMWDHIDDNGGSIFLLKINTTLAAMNDTEFKVIATNDTTKSLTEKNRELISDAMEKVTGKRRKMVIRTADGNDDSPASEEKVEPPKVNDEMREKGLRAAEEMEKLFGIKTRVE